jgi:hypothetical protein
LTQYATSRVAYVKFLHELGREIKAGRLKSKVGSGKDSGKAAPAATSDHSEL